MPAALRDFAASVRSHEGAFRGDGWSIHDVPDNILGQGPEPLLNLVTASSSPVIAAYIADSDYGQVIAATPSGDRWGVWLDRDTAYAFERDHHVMNATARATARRRARETIAAFGCPPGEAVRHAANWAAEAGYTVASAGNPIHPGHAHFDRLSRACCGRRNQAHLGSAAVTARR